MSTTLLETKSVFLDALDLPMMISERKLHRHAAEVGEKMELIVGAINGVVPRLSLVSPRLPTVQDQEDFKMNCETWASWLETSLMSSDQVGKVKVTGDTAVCTFYENHEQKGWFDDKHWTVRHAHKVFRPKLRRLPCDIDIPAKGQAIIDRLSNAGLERSIRILTGELIGEHQETTKEWTERAALGRIVDDVKGKASATMAFVQSNAKALGAGVASLGAVALGAAGIPFMAISAGDPAIVIGDTCFWGWIE